MANFNLADYETVEERIKRFYSDHPNGRIITKNLTTKEDRQVSTWVVRAKVFIPNPLADKEKYSEEYILKATGLAFEIDGGSMANKTSALENAETSAIGRALANAGYSGNKRASREEMQKVARASQTAQDGGKALARDWKAEIAALGTVEAARALYSDAQRAQAGQFVLKAIEARVQSFGK